MQFLSTVYIHRCCYCTMPDRKTKISLLEANIFGALARRMIMELEKVLNLKFLVSRFLHSLCLSILCLINITLSGKHKFHFLLFLSPHTANWGDEKVQESISRARSGTIYHEAAQKRRQSFTLADSYRLKKVHLSGKKREKKFCMNSYCDSFKSNFCGLAS